MRICIPIQTDDGMSAMVNGHFGTAPYFLIYDSDADAFEVIANAEEHHNHGRCSPMNIVKAQNVDTLVCVGMGVRAVQQLHIAGLKVYKVEMMSAEDAIGKLTDGVLKEISIDDACTHQSCH